MRTTQTKPRRACTSLILLRRGIGGGSPAWGLQAYDGEGCAEATSVYQPSRAICRRISSARPEHRLHLRPRLVPPGRRGDGADQQQHANPREQIRNAVHSITWSVRCSSEGGIVKPSAFAVLRL